MCIPGSDICASTRMCACEKERTIRMSAEERVEATEHVWVGKFTQKVRKDTYGMVIQITMQQSPFFSPCLTPIT